MILKKMHTTTLCGLTLTLSLSLFATAVQSEPHQNERHNGPAPHPQPHLQPHPQPHLQPHPQLHHQPVHQHRIQNSKPVEINHRHGATVIKHQEINKHNAQPNIVQHPRQHGPHQPNIPIAPAHNKVINTVRPNNINVPLHVVTNNKPSYLSNHFTQNNMHTAATWNQHFIHGANNAHWVHQINGYQNQYHNQFYNHNVQRFNVYGHYWQNNHYHNWYSSWYRWGFYGGFWYPVRPFFAIENYFTYPAVQWFFVDEPLPPTYYSSYYISDSAPPAGCSGAFPYKHIYFPTDTLRDLLVEVSGFPQGLRCNFRTDVIHMSQQLRQAISTYFAINFSFQPNYIVVNYYQNLQNKAIVISGFVNQGKINTAFEALLDLQNPNRSITFVPDGQTPTEDQLSTLNQLNNRIKSLGGDPFTAQQEPSRVANDDGNAGGANQGSAPGP